MRTARSWPALLVVTLVLAGCGLWGPTDGPAVSPPTGAGDLVLRLTLLPGLLQPGGAAAVPPDYSLYGDGRLITGPRPDAPGVWPIFEQHQTGEAGRLLQQASDAGLLDGSASSRSTSTMPDAPVLVVTVASTTARRTTTVPASDGPTARLRDEMAALAKGTGTPYGPAAVAVISTANDDPSATVRTWPLAQLDGQPLSDLSAGARCTVLRAADVETVRDAAAGATAATLWRNGEHRWALTFRPLLPDEADCSAF